MKVFSWSVGNDVVMRYVVTKDAPVNPSAENYRFDIKYNEQVRDPGFCAVDYFDTDKNDWASLSGTPADIYLYNTVIDEPEFAGAEYLYYTLQTTDVDTTEPETNMVDVTPTQGDNDVPRLT